MRIQPAKLDQVLQTTHGEMVLVSADVGGVASELREIDPGLKVRFAERASPPFWAVYWESEDGRVTQLVNTFAAHQNNSGVWEGLDGRVVARIREIDAQGRSGYDFAKELEKSALRRTEEKRKRFAESIGDGAERTAHALRKDLGLGPYKGRVFKPRDV